MGWLELILHPSDIRAIAQWKIWRDPVHTREPENESENLRKCYELLDATSRSFSSVIQELNPGLREAVVVFYLVLRGLDTVEDDMTLPLATKEPLLRNFHKTIYEEGWTFDGSGPNEKDAHLLRSFDVVIREFAGLKPAYQRAITDACAEMGAGMADFCAENEKHGFSVTSVADYDQYCHYVAGIVGIGLSNIFSDSELEDPRLKQATKLSNSMGLFLQKTNIIRDYAEDLRDGRCFWPREIWSKYCDDIAELQKPENLDAGLNCSSDLVLNALAHAPDSIAYLSVLRDQSVFNFCAIPQVMAIATLAKVFRNPDVFHTNVKIRKGVALRLMWNATNPKSVCDIFVQFVREIHNKNDPRDPNFLQISLACARVEQFCETVFPRRLYEEFEAEREGRITPRMAARRQKEANERAAKGEAVPAPSEAARLAKEKEEGLSMQKELLWIVLAVFVFWLIVIAIMVAIAMYFGARFDVAFEAGAKRFHEIMAELGLAGKHSSSDPLQSVMGAEH